VSVRPPPLTSPRGWHLKLDAEKRCHIRNLPEALRFDCKYRNRQFWYDFLIWEHTVRRRSTRHHDYYPWESYDVADSPSPLPDEEDKDDEDYHVIKKEADVAMEDIALPPGAGDLPSEYQAVVAVGYDEEALLQQVLEASKANEDKIFSGYNDGIALTGMVAEHLALLPPPPPLPPHA
jgi:hypothetical protein